MRRRCSQTILLAGIIVLWAGIGPPLFGADPPPAAGVGAAKPLLVVQLGHSDSVNSAAVSPDGKLVLTGSYDDTARLWDAASGNEIRRFIGHTAQVSSVAFTPNGAQVLTGSFDSTARLWDAASGKEIRRFEGHSGQVMCVAISPDGKQVLTGSTDKTARLWDAASGKEIRRFEGFTGWVNSVAFSPDGKQVLIGGDDAARLWDAASGAEIRRFVGHSDTVTSVAFSANGKQILTGSYDRTARLWDAASGNEIRRFVGHESRVLSVAFSPDGTQALSGSGGFEFGDAKDHTARLWDCATGKEIRRFDEHAGDVNSVAFSPDGKRALTGNHDDTARLWDAASGKEIRRFEGRARPVAAAVFSPDGKQVLTGGDDAARLWDLASGMEIRRFEAHSDRVASVAFSPDGKQVLTGSADGTVQLWDTASGKELHRFAGHSNPIAFSPDGKQILTGCVGSTAELWDAASGAEIRRFKGHSDSIWSLAFSPDGKQALTSGSWDNEAWLWDVSSGDAIRGFDVHSTALHAEISSLAFSPDGKQVLAGTWDHTARLWDLASGKDLRIFEGHSAEVTSVAFSPDGKQILTGSSDMTARLWDVASGAEIHRFEGHTGAVASVAFSPDGKYALTGSGDCTCRIWNVASGKQLCALVSFTKGDWAVVDSAGRFDASHGGDVEGLHWVVGNDPIKLSQLKQRYYEPGLLAKYLGFDKEPLRNVESFTAPKLFPLVNLTPPAPGQTKFAISLTNQGGGIGKVVVKINGKEFSGDARGAKPDPNAATLSIPVDLANDPRLVPGAANSIEVEAFNAEGYLSSRGIRIVYQDPRPKEATTEKPDLWALVVGISHYQSGQIELTYPAKDADDFAAGLQVAATRLVGSDKVHLTKLTSPPPGAASQPDAAHRPTRDNLLAALQTLQDPKRIKPNDVVVVYMAGHGVNGSGSDDRFYYLTCDAQGADSSDPEVHKEWAISDQDLTQWIKMSPALHQVMILDTCASGRLIEDLTKPRDVPSSQGRALERLKDNTGLHILAGCAADQQSYEASQYGQGLLTYSLLLGMRGGALREAQFVDVATLFHFAADEVPQLALGIGIQRPQIDSPNGASFDIGEVKEEDKPHIPLEPPRPLVLRTNFQDRDAVFDVLNLAKQTDDVLRGLSSQENAPLFFIDAGRMPSAYQVAGRYTVKAEQVSVDVHLATADGKGVNFSVEGVKSKVPDLAKAICDAVQKRLPAKTASP